MEVLNMSTIIEYIFELRNKYHLKISKELEAYLVREFLDWPENDLIEMHHRAFQLVNLTFWEGLNNERNFFFEQVSSFDSRNQGILDEHRVAMNFLKGLKIEHLIHDSVFMAQLQLLIVQSDLYKQANELPI
jgi:hypothetical protein